MTRKVRNLWPIWTKRSVDPWLGFEIILIWQTWADSRRLVARIIIPRNEVAIVKCHVTIPFKMIDFERFASDTCCLKKTRRWQISSWKVRNKIGKNEVEKFEPKLNIVGLKVLTNLNGNLIPTYSFFCCRFQLHISPSRYRYFYAWVHVRISSILKVFVRVFQNCTNVRNITQVIHRIISCIVCLAFDFSQRHSHWIKISVS